MSMSAEVFKTRSPPPYFLGSDSLIGRSAEKSILLNSYFASLSMGQDSAAAVILIRGESGLGKTKLAETLRSHVVEDDGYFIRGKFDQLSYGSADRPYSGIASVFAEYCSALEQRSRETWNEVASKLRREIKGEEEKVLFEAIPSLRKIIGDSAVECRGEETVVQRRHSCDACQHHVNNNVEEGKTLEKMDNFSDCGSHRLNYLIRRVVAVISSIGDPIVCLIDDVQWANKTEMNALEALMNGAINPFVFIFTCRPGNHPFLKITDDFGGTTEILLQSLKRDSVRELVAYILRMDHPDDCTSLANLISRITNGNPFYVNQQIISLWDDGFLRFGNNGWVWDIKEIEEMHDDTSGDVLIMLQEKMKKLPALIQQALKICSSIGSKIDLNILGLLIRETQSDMQHNTEDNETLAKTVISVAIQEGLLAVTQNGKGVTFTHDSVNEAAYSLLESEQQAPYHLKLGQILLKNVCPNLLQKYLFAIAAQLARGIELITDEGDRIDAASTFLRAGEKSMAASAFPEAHFFFAKGIYLLHEDDWTSNFRLCCDIYTKAADTAALTADFRDMDKCLAILFYHCKESIVNYLNASFIQVRTMVSQGNPKALEAGLEALRLAGENFPSRNLIMHTVFGFAQTRHSMKNKGADKLLQLPPITDKQMIATLRLLHLLAVASMGFNPKMLPLFCFRIVKLNLTHGMSKSMPSAVALYGTIIGRFGYPLTETAKYGQIALTLQRELKCNETMAHVILLTYGSTFTRMYKLSDCIKPLRSGYDSGVKTGEITHAAGCGTVIGGICFFSGQKLAKVASTLKKLRASMSAYNMTTALKSNHDYQNAVDYCLGITRAPQFYYMQTNPDDCTISFEKNNIMLREVSKFIQLVLACIFCEDELAWTISEKLGQFGSTFAGSIWRYMCAFYRGMAAMSMLHRSKTREYVQTAKSCLKELRKGYKKSMRNISHQLYLLEAEYAASRNSMSAKRFYLLAIEHAAISNVTHEHAYACERFGTYHFLQQNHDAAYEQIREAHILYSKWGSRPKCELLKKKYPRLGEKEHLLVPSHP